MPKKKRATEERSERRFTYSRRGVRFVWEGGPYIDVHFASGGGGVPFEVINVWDYETNQSGLERDRGAFVAECEAWLEATPPEEINNYRANHHY